MNAAAGDYGVAPGGPPKFTRLSKALAGVLAGLCLLSLVSATARGYLLLVPGRTLPCVWNLLTASFVTTNPGKALAEIAALLLLARAVEPMYGSTELLRLILVSALASGVATFVGVYLLYLASPSKEGTVLYAEFGGFHGVVGGLLVAAKQIMADQEIQLAGLPPVTAKYLPALYVAGGALLGTLLRAWTALPFLVLGPYAAWVYLRFFQAQPESGGRGDPSDEFKFSGFFPPAVEGPIDAFAGICGRIFFLRHPDGAAAAAAAGADGEGASLLGAPLGGESKEASRRRERGAKALEERLAGAKPAAAAAAGAVGGSGGGDLEDGGAAAKD